MHSRAPAASWPDFRECCPRHNAGKVKSRKSGTNKCEYLHEQSEPLQVSKALAQPFERACLLCKAGQGYGDLSKASSGPLKQVCKDAVVGDVCNDGLHRANRADNGDDTVEDNNRPVDGGCDKRMLAHFLPEDDGQDEVHRGKPNGSHKGHKVPANAS